MFYLLTDSYTVRPEMVAQTGSVIPSSIIKYNSEAAGTVVEATFGTIHH